MTDYAFSSIIALGMIGYLIWVYQHDDTSRIAWYEWSDGFLRLAVVGIGNAALILDHEILFFKNAIRTLQKHKKEKFCPGLIGNTAAIPSPLPDRINLKRPLKLGPLFLL